MSSLEGQSLALTRLTFSPWFQVVAIGTMMTLIVRFQLVQCLLELLREIVWIPFTVSKQMRKQGHLGPSFSVFKNHKQEIRELAIKASSEPLLTSSGMSHDLLPRLFSHLVTWRNLYGDNFLFKQGWKVTMHTSDVEAIKEIFSNKFSNYGKCPMSTLAVHILGSNGLLFADGEEWTKQRRVTRPAFYPGRSKKMVDQMASWIELWLERLDNLVLEKGGNSFDVDIYSELGDLMKDILARSSFGSSYAKGKEGFEHQERLKDLALKQGVISNPLLRWMPTAQRKELEKEKGEVFRCLREIIQERRSSIESGDFDSYGDDLLGLLLADTDKRLVHDGRSHRELKKEDERITDQCRTFFFAGQETIHNVLSWTIVLLGHYTNWQERIRAELQEAFKGALPDGDKLMKLNQLNMFVEETLRLYGPTPVVHRQVVKDNVTLLGEPLPKNLVIVVNLAALHQDKQQWGEDSLEFKPERFANGMAKASKKPYAFQPFGGGPRICVAQVLAMVELKLVLAMLLQRFSFRLSPSYRHEPVMRLTIEPKCGVQVVLERIRPSRT